MTRIGRILLASAGFALLGASAGVQAQSYAPWTAVAAPRLYLGGSIGAANYADATSTTAGWLNSYYTNNVGLSPGDYITSGARQDSSSFGGKVYGGAWITPFLGVEVGYAWLGSIGWDVDSVNTTGSFAVHDRGTVRPSLWYEALLLGVDNGGFKIYGKAGAYQAQTHVDASDYDYNSGAFFSASDNLRNSGALLGVGVSAPTYLRGAWRLELEDYLNVGQSNTSTVPPWRGNVLLLSAGYSFLF
jgi:hypothetical protein